MDFNTKLIELVKNYKSIYDTNDPTYGDAASRHDAWKEIARKLETQESECRKSWMLLREGYRRFLKKQIASENDPIFRRDKLAKKWTYEEHLSFLSPHFRKLYHSSINNHINVEESGRDHLALPAIPENTEQKRALPKRTRTHEAVSRRSSSHDTHSNTLIKYILDRTMKKNDIQQFFDSVASTVQSFPTREKALAKARVFDIISRMEMEILGRGSANTSPSTSPSSNDMEGQDSRNNLYITPPPEGLQSAGFLESNGFDEDSIPQLIIKMEPEHLD